MNTKKARGKRSPLGRCLKSTKLWPDVQRTERTWTKTKITEREGNEKQSIFHLENVKVSPLLIRGQGFPRTSTVKIIELTDFV